MEKNMKEKKSKFTRHEFLVLSGAAIAGAGLMNFPLPALAKLPEKKSISVLKKDILAEIKELGGEEIREKFAEKSYKLGYEYLSKRTYPGCALSVIAAIQDTLDIRDDSVFKAATGLSGGTGGTRAGTCGTCAGGATVFGQLYGCERSNSDLKGCTSKSYNMTALLADEFKREFGSIICQEIRDKLFGRCSDFKSKEEYEQFIKANAAEKCSDVVGKGAQFTVKLILDDIFSARESRE